MPSSRACPIALSINNESVSHDPIEPCANSSNEPSHCVLDVPVFIAPTNSHAMHTRGKSSIVKKKAYFESSSIPWELKN